MKAPEVTVTIIRPELTPAERERRREEARKALAAFYVAFAEKNGVEAWARLLHQSTSSQG